MNKYRNNLPENIYSKGIRLEKHVGVKEVAWKYQDAIAVIEILETKGYKILGGDVYSMNEGVINVTYDNWYFKSDVNDDLVKASVKMAKEYIETYHKINGKTYLYSIIF